MKLYTKIINEETKECLILNQIEAKKFGLEEIDVEFSYDGRMYLKGYAPKKSLEDLKQEKIQQLKNNANNYIINKYPYYKQLNIIRNGTMEELAKMSSFIDKIRNKINQLELDIDSCNKEEELSIINYNNIYDNNE